jgi:hypothetical protein
MLFSGGEDANIYTIDLHFVVLVTIGMAFEYAIIVAPSVALLYLGRCPILRSCCMRLCCPSSPDFLSSNRFILPFCDLHYIGALLFDMIQPPPGFQLLEDVFCVGQFRSGPSSGQVVVD